MSASEAKQEVVKQQIQNLSDLASFNAFCIVKLSNGQTVSTQLTYRHGIPEDKYIEDFKTWYRILDKLAQDGGDEPYVDFWNGAKTTPSAPASVSQPAQPSNGAKSNGNGQNLNEFAAGLLTVEFKGSGKERRAYYKVEAPEGAKFPRYPVTIWPEVIVDAGIVVDNIDPKDGFSLLGWTAVYEKNEKGFPHKVTKLVKPDFA